MVWITDRSSLMDGALMLRNEVFVHEQGVPVEIEVDEYDPLARHLVAMADSGRVVGTLRLIVTGDRAKIGRVAVERSIRGMGLGRQLMLEGLAEARRVGCTTALVASQVTVIGFYHGLGFEVVSEPFDDAGIAHVNMVGTL